MGKQHIFLVHGIRAKDKGAASMGRLAKKLSSWFDSVHKISYGYILIPINNKKAVQSIVERIQPYEQDDRELVLVGYSNGAWAALQVAELGHKVDHLILISPALHRSHAIPEQVKRVDVFYSTGDNIVQLGRVYRMTINLFPWNWKIFGGQPHNWGAMGKYGYLGNDPRVHNHDMGSDVGHSWHKFPLVINMIASHIKLLFQKDTPK